MSYPCAAITVCQQLQQQQHQQQELEEGHSSAGRSYLDGLPAQDEEGLGSLGQEARKLVDQNVLNLVGLLDLDADADRVDAGLDEDALVLVAGNRQRRQEHLGRRLGLDLGDIVPFSRLRGKVGQREGRRQTAPDALEVRAEGLRL